MSDLNETPTLPPPNEQDLLHVANLLEAPLADESEQRVAQFLRLLAPRMKMFEAMLG